MNNYQKTIDNLGQHITDLTEDLECEKERSRVADLNEEIGHLKEWRIQTNIWWRRRLRVWALSMIAVGAVIGFVGGVIAHGLLVLNF